VRATQQGHGQSNSDLRKLTYAVVYMGIYHQLVLRLTLTQLHMLIVSNYALYLNRPSHAMVANQKPHGRLVYSG
jgi:hypothetical protein